jgi:N6-adenosine-specific RNA methylase IME4
MRFRTVLCDPPWDYEVWSPGGKHKSPDNHYSVMSMDDILNLPIAPVCEKDAVCLLWCTWPMLRYGLLCLRQWGFEYKSGFPWVKMGRSGAVQIGTGYHARACSEPLLIGTRGNPPVAAPADRPAGLLWDEDGAGVLLNGRSAHSAKPQSQYCIAEKYPGPYLSLFDRPWWGMLEPPDNWVFLGNEIPGCGDIRDDLLKLAAGELVTA